MIPRAAENASPREFRRDFLQPSRHPSCRCERARPGVFLFSHLLRDESEGCAVTRGDISNIKFAGRGKKKGIKKTTRTVRNDGNRKIASIKSEWIGLEGTKEFLFHVTALLNHFLPLADSLPPFCAIASCSMLSS